jgi:hypothetical protein
MQKNGLSKWGGVAGCVVLIGEFFSLVRTNRSVIQNITAGGVAPVSPQVFGAERKKRAGG